MFLLGGLLLSFIFCLVSHQCVLNLQSKNAYLGSLNRPRHNYFASKDCRSGCRSGNTLAKCFWGILSRTVAPTLGTCTWNLEKNSS